MKTARRHELQTNTLADWTGKALDDARPYGKMIAGTLLALVVLVVAYVVVSQRSQRGQEQSWNAYFQALNSENPADLEAVVQAYPNDSAGRWAALMLADRQLADGLSQLLADQAAATQALRDALDNYGRAAEDPDDTIRQRAHLGLAKAHESLRELDEAREEYQSLLDRWPEGIFASVATSRLADLETKSTKEFYDWLARQKSATPPAGLGEPGLRPPFDLDSFNHPPLDGEGGTSEDEATPSIGDIILPQAGEPEEVEATPGDETGGSEEPATDEESPAGDAPIDEPAADEETGGEPAAEPASESASSTDADADSP